MTNIKNKLSVFEFIGIILFPLIAPIIILFLCYRKASWKFFEIKFSVIIFNISNLLYWISMLMYGGLHVTTILAASMINLFSMMPLYENYKDEHGIDNVFIRLIYTFVPVIFSSIIFTSILAKTGIASINEECSFSTLFFFAYTFLHAIVFYNVIRYILEEPGMLLGFITHEGAKNIDEDAGHIIITIALFTPLIFVIMLSDESIYKAFSHFSCVFK